MRSISTPLDRPESLIVQLIIGQLLKLVQKNNKQFIYFNLIFFFSINGPSGGRKKGPGKGVEKVQLTNKSHTSSKSNENSHSANSGWILKFNQNFIYFF